MLSDSNSLMPTLMRLATFFAVEEWKEEGEKYDYEWMLRRDDDSNPDIVAGRIQEYEEVTEKILEEVEEERIVRFRPLEGLKSFGVLEEMVKERLEEIESQPSETKKKFTKAVTSGKLKDEIKRSMAKKAEENETELADIQAGKKKVKTMNTLMGAILHEGKAGGNVTSKRKHMVFKEEIKEVLYGLVNKKQLDKNKKNHTHTSKRKKTIKDNHQISKKDRKF